MSKSGADESCVVELLCEGGMAEQVDLRVAFRELREAVRDVQHFGSPWEELGSTLDSLDRFIQDIERRSSQLGDVVRSITSIIVEGKKLVSKCRGASRILASLWNIFMVHSGKLEQLDNKLLRFIKQTRQQPREELNRIPHQIESSAAGDTAGGVGPIHSRPPMPPPLPNRAPTTRAPPRPPNNRAPRIGTLGLMLVVILPNINVTLKITAMIILIFKEIVTPIISILEKSEIWMVIKDVSDLETTTKLLDDTMKSLAPVLKEIESNKADPSEDAKRLRSLLEEGKKLDHDSANTGQWNFVKKWQCQKKMVQLDNKLLRFHKDLQTRLPKNIDDDSVMKDHESFEPPAHYDQDSSEIRGNMDAREHNSYDMLNDNTHQYLYYQGRRHSSLIGGFRQLGR